MKFAYLEGNTCVAEEREEFCYITQHTHLEGPNGRRIMITNEVWEYNIPDATTVACYTDRKMDFATKWGGLR